MKPLNREMFRTTTLRDAPAQVDRNHNVIYGAKIMELGEVHDSRPYIVDEETLAGVIKLGTRPKRGLKARFTHESMSDDGLARHMGRWKNFRREGNAVKADLHIADVAFDSPEGDLGGYVMDLAEEDPESFGVSLATVFDRQAMSKLEQQAEKEAEEGEKPKPTPLRFSKIHSADFVGNPATTDGLFSDPGDERNLPAIASQIMDYYFTDSRPEEVLERFTGFLSKYYGKEITMPDNNLNQDTPSEASVEDQTQVQATPEQGAAPEGSAASDDSAHERFVSAFGERGALWYLEGKSFEECLQLRTQEQDTKIDELTKQNEDLQTKLDAALNASGEQDPLSVEPPATDKEREKAQRARDAKKKGVNEASAQWATSLYGDLEQAK